MLYHIIILLIKSVQISSVKCNIKKKRGGGAFWRGGAKWRKYGMSEKIGHRAIWGRCSDPSLNFYTKLLKQNTGTADHMMVFRLSGFQGLPSH